MTRWGSLEAWSRNETILRSCFVLCARGRVLVGPPAVLLLHERCVRHCAIHTWNVESPWLLSSTITSTPTSTCAAQQSMN